MASFSSTAFSTSAFSVSAFDFDSTPPAAGITGYGPGWKMIFDQDMLAKWEKERLDEGSRKRFISTAFDRIYGRAPTEEQVAETKAEEPAALIANLKRDKEIAWRLTRDKHARAQMQILGALQERAQEMAKAKAAESRRAIEDDDEDVLGVIL